MNHKELEIENAKLKAQLIWALSALRPFEIAYNDLKYVTEDMLKNAAETIQRVEKNI